MKSSPLLLLLAASTMAPGQLTVPVASRNVDAEAYVAAMRDRLSIADRQQGPFGLSQTPSRKIFKPEDRDTRPEHAGPSFSTVVASIPVTGIDSHGREIVIGARSFGEGDLIPLDYRGATINAQVVRVSSDSVLFRDLHSGDEATRSLKIGPTEDKLRKEPLPLPKGLQYFDRAPIVVPVG